MFLWVIRMEEKNQSSASLDKSFSDRICLAYVEILVKISTHLSNEHMLPTTTHTGACGGEFNRGIRNENGGCGDGHSCVGQNNTPHLCHEAGLDIDISKHGAWC